MPIGLYAEVLSPSAVECYETCPKQYYYKVQGFKPRPYGGWAKVGTCLHQLMEAFIDMRYKRTLPQAMRYSRLNKEWWPDEVTNEALGLADKWLDHNTLPDIVKAGNLIFPITELAFGPPGDKVHGVVVKESNFLSFDSGLKIHGFIDMIYAEIKDGQITGLVVVDWKTQRKKISDLAFKRQAQIYALAVHKITKLPVRVEFVFLRFPADQPMRWNPSLDDLDKIEGELAELQQHIKTIDHDKIAPRISDDCKFCSYNYTCSEFKKWIERPEGEHAIWDTMPIEDLVEEFDRVRIKFLALKRVKDDLHQLLLADMDRRNIDKIGPFEMRYRWSTDWTDEARSVISKGGGLDNLPSQVVDELYKYHLNKSPSKPFLYKYHVN